MFGRLPEAAMPATNSSESPGRKKPTISPVSANMIAQTPIRPNVSIRSLALSGLNAMPSVRARVFSAVSTGNEGTGSMLISGWAGRGRLPLRRAGGAVPPRTGADALVGRGRLDLEQARLVAFRLVRLVPAAQPEQPLRQQDVEHGRDVDDQR